MSAGAYLWCYVLKCVSYHGLKQNGRRLYPTWNPFAQQIRFLNGETDILSCQETAVTDIVLILHNVSLCQRAWVIGKQSRVIRD